MKFEMIDIDDYEIFELAGVCAEHIDATFKYLKSSIEKYGILVPVVIYDNKIIDGRVRHILAKELSITSLPAIILDDGYFDFCSQDLRGELSLEVLKHINVGRAIPQIILDRMG